MNLTRLTSKTLTRMSLFLRPSQTAPSTLAVSSLPSLRTTPPLSNLELLLLAHSTIQPYFLFSLTTLLICLLKIGHLHYTVLEVQAL